MHTLLPPRRGKGVIPGLIVAGKGRRPCQQQRLLKEKFPPKPRLVGEGIAHHQTQLACGQLLRQRYRAVLRQLDVDQRVF